MRKNFERYTRNILRAYIFFQLNLMEHVKENIFLKPDVCRRQNNN